MVYFEELAGTRGMQFKLCPLLQHRVLHFWKLHRFVPDLFVQRDDILVIERALEQEKERQRIRWTCACACACSSVLRRLIPFQRQNSKV